MYYNLDNIGRMFAKDSIFIFILVLTAHVLAFGGMAFVLKQSRPEPVEPEVIQALLLRPPPIIKEVPIIPPKKVEQPKELPKEKPKPKPIEKMPPKVEEPIPIPVVPVETAINIEQPPPTPPEPVVEAPLSMPTNDSSVDNPQPDYPRQSRRFGEEGTVLLEIEILPNGHVGGVRLKISSGHQRLDKAAIDTVKTWRYIPAKRGNQPISYWFEQSVKFVLN